LAPREIARRNFGNREPNPRNPRRNFSDIELDELASSIRGRGIVQPIVVRPARSYADTFEIIAGERRWRAGLHQVPIVALEVNDDEALQLAIIENVQRADLNPLEEAAGYQSLVNEFRHSQEDVANTLRLLRLPERSRVELLGNRTATVSDLGPASDHIGTANRSRSWKAGHFRERRRGPRPNVSPATTPREGTAPVPEQRFERVRFAGVVRLHKPAFRPRRRPVSGPTRGPGHRRLPLPLLRLARGRAASGALRRPAASLGAWSTLGVDRDRTGPI
jgi:hypothetical protein